MGKNLFILAILTMSLMACSTKEDVADEREPLKPETPVEKDEWETIQPDGGVIERDDITIQFPKGTFSSETKVAVSEVKKGQILGEDEVSKFYQITMPVSTGAAMTIEIQSEEQAGDIVLVANMPSRSMHQEEASYAITSFDATYQQGKYKVTIPKFDNGTSTDDISFSVGMAHRAQFSNSKNIGKKASTRTIEGEKEGDISWYYDTDRAFEQTYAVQLAGLIDDLNSYIHTAIKQIHDLKFTVREKRRIPIQFKALGQDIYGLFKQSPFDDKYSHIELNLNILTTSGLDRETLKQTVIHEFFHYFQADYDARWYFSKYRNCNGDELMMYESGATWIEKFMNGGIPPSRQFAERLPHFLRGLINLEDIYKDDATCLDKNGKLDIGKARQSHGYAMGALLEYMTKQMGNKKILDFYEYWARESKSTFDNLQYLANEGNLMTFYGGYDDFITSCCLGEVVPELSGPNFCDAKSITIRDGNLSGVFKGDIYPYGSHIRKLIIQGFKDTSLKDKELVFKPLTKGVHLQLIRQTTKDLQLLSNFAETPDSIVINGSDLEKLRRTDNNEIRAQFYIITGTYEKSNTIPYELNVELRDLEQSEIKVTSFNSVYFYCHLNSKIKRTNLDLSTNLGFYSDYYKDVKFTVSQSKETVHVEGSHKSQYSADKGEKGESETYISFDITGFTGNLAKCKIENFTYTYSSEEVYPNDWDYDVSRDVDNIKCTLTDIPASEVNLLPNVWTEDGIKSMGILSFDGKGEKAFKVLEFEHTDTFYDKKGNPVTDEYELTPSANDEIEFSITFYYTSKKK